jgi:hypothetical protein
VVIGVKCGADRATVMPDRDGLVPALRPVSMEELRQDRTHLDDHPPNRWRPVAGRRCPVRPTLPGSRSYKVRFHKDFLNIRSFRSANRLDWTGFTESRLAGTLL